MPDHKPPWQPFDLDAADHELKQEILAAAAAGGGRLRQVPDPDNDGCVVYELADEEGDFAEATDVTTEVAELAYRERLLTVSDGKFSVVGEDLGTPKPGTPTPYPTGDLTIDEIGHAAGMLRVIADPDDGAMRAMDPGTSDWFLAAQTAALYRRRSDGEDPSEQEWRDVAEKLDAALEQPEDYEGDQDQVERVCATIAVSCAADAGRDRGNEKAVRDLTEAAMENAESAVGYGVRAMFERESNRAKEELTQDARWKAEARERMLAQAGTPEGVNVDTDDLNHHHTAALIELLDEGKLVQLQDGDHVVLKLNDAGHAEAAGTPTQDVDPDPTVCGATEFTREHPFEPNTHVRDSEGYYDYEFCKQPADAPVHHAPGAEPDAERDAHANTGGGALVHDLHAAFTVKYRRLPAEVADAVIACGRIATSATVTDLAMAWARTQARFSPDDRAVLAALREAETKMLSASWVVESAAHDMLEPITSVIEMLGRHIQLAAAGAAGGAYRA